MHPFHLPLNSPRNLDAGVELCAHPPNNPVTLRSSLVLPLCRHALVPASNPGNH